MDDLAREVGVSKITVSRALADPPGVREATRERVRAVAEARGFRLNVAARNLRQQRTRTIAVVIEMTPSHDRSMSEPYPLSLLGGILQELSGAAYNMVLTTMAVFERAPPAVDGVILLGQGLYEDAVDKVQKSGLPYVIWGSVDGNEDHITVGSNNVHGGRLAADHLLFLGRRAMVFLGETRHLEIADRLAGFKTRLAENGARLMATLHCPFTEDGGHGAMKALLETAPRNFDGVFAASDAIAIGAIRALQEAQVAVPDEVAIVGFDDAPSAVHCQPALTSVRQNWDEGGMLLARKILDLTHGRAVKSQAMPVLFKARET
ncbi:MAG: LacI family DNA-binding transcriptional regulator [Alphaproteobacteria bacterium]|nr:LacI family DNA-binding transcriptional regulator [Alphaproteobacteria bacterium]